MNQTEIREIKPDEQYLMKDLLYEAIFQRDGEPRLPKEIINEPNIRIYIDDWGKPDDLCLVALNDGEIVGAVWTRILSGDIKGYGFVDDRTPEFAIALFKEYRHKGIGTVLMQKMIDKLKAAGYQQASLSVEKENYACNMYIKLGFQVIAELKRDYLMVLELK